MGQSCKLLRRPKQHKSKLTSAQQTSSIIIILSTSHHSSVNPFLKCHNEGSAPRKLLSSFSHVESRTKSESAKKKKQKEKPGTEELA